MKIPSPVKKALRILKSGGFEGYLVGGCVRDFLQGIEPHDYDLATNATPAEIMALFEPYRLILAGLSHGTVTPIIGHMPIEITTYRTEDGYTDHRRPDAVFFTKHINEDLARRDFTVNAMAWRPRGGLTDPYGGRADLEAKILRCVGDARARFNEDALRILRALRFAARLDFTIEPATAAAMLECAPALDSIARERKTEELLLILQHKTSGRLFDEFAGVFAQVLPELAGVAADPDLRARAACALETLDGEHRPRMALLAHLAEDPALFSRLTLTRIDRTQINLILQGIRWPIPQTPPDLRKLAARFGMDNAQFILWIKSALGEDTEQAEKIMLECAEREDCIHLSGLAINGRDLLGLMPQRQIGQALARCLLAVMEDRVENRYAALLEYVKCSMDGS